VTTLGIGIDANTATQQFSFGIGADLQFEDLSGGRREENGIEKPFARLDYTLNGTDSRLTFNGSYRTDSILDSVFLDTDGDLIQDTVITSDGTTETFNVSAGYSFGLQAPFGMDFTVGRDERNYSNTVDPNLYDRSTDIYGIVARFRFNSNTQARLIAQERKFSADDSVQTERDTTDLGVGLDYQIQPDLRFSGQITQTDIEEVRTTGVQQNDGISASLDLTRDLVNGTIGVTASRVQSTDTARSTLRVDRAMTLPMGALSFGVGPSWSDTGDTVLIGSLDYSTLLPNGAITASLARTASVNVDDDEIRTTNLDLAYIRTINPVSSMDFRVNVADISDAGAGTTNDGTRADFRVGYRQQLTPDWDWTLGYVHRYRKFSDGSTASSNAIVTSIGRSFSIRP
jgi:hypothetical protein